MWSRWRRCPRRIDPSVAAGSHPVAVVVITVVASRSQSRPPARHDVVVEPIPCRHVVAASVAARSLRSWPRRRPRRIDPLVAIPSPSRCGRRRGVARASRSSHRRVVVVVVAAVAAPAPRRRRGHRVTSPSPSSHVVVAVAGPCHIVVAVASWSQLRPARCVAVVVVVVGVVTSSRRGRGRCSGTSPSP